MMNLMKEAQFCRPQFVDTVLSCDDIALGREFLYYCVTKHGKQSNKADKFLQSKNVQLNFELEGNIRKEHMGTLFLVISRNISHLHLAIRSKYTKISI